MKAIIVDDEFSGRNGLKMLIERFCPDVEVVAICESVAQAIQDIAAKRPEIVFLDIEMPHQNGFDLLKTLPSISFEIIFVTAYNKYAIQAIRFNALDYLLKPVQPDELILALERVKKKQTLGSQHERFGYFLQSQKQDLGGKLAVPTREGFLFLNVDQIVRCEADSNYCNLFMRSGEKITSSKTLANFEELLQDGPFTFIRVHSAHLININFIKSYTKGEGGTLVLEDGTEIPVSRRKKDLLLNTLKI